MCTVAPSLSNAILPAGFCAYELPVSISQTRSIISLGTSSLLALERGTSSVVLLDDTDGDGLPNSKATVATAPSLNHGLGLHDSYLYASSDEVVYRWEFSYGDEDRDDRDNPAAAVAIVGQRTVVIDNMNAVEQGGVSSNSHRTRTLAFDNDSSQLYVSVGSAGNVDANSLRSRIRRFNITDSSTFPLDFLEGEVFADGLRNEVGLAFDKHGVLFGVENGADNLMRGDLGGDIHNDNPAEELNRFREEDAGKHWGYPYCWTEYKLDDAFGLGRGTAWAWPSFMDNITDAQCRNDYQPAVMSMQAHTAPLGIVFYNYTKDRPKTCTGGFPPEMDGYAFIALHGSWNRNVPVGYSVVYARMDANGDPMDDEPVDFLTHKLPGAKWGDGFRPVDVDFDTCGRLLVSSDGTKSLGYGGSKVVRVEHHEELVGGPAPSGNTNVAITPSLAPVQSDAQPASSSSSTVKNRLLFGETALTLLFGIVHLLA